jgi:RimJ/RimL family protein N-acetyltransferase
MIAIRTERLDLVAAALVHLEAELESPQRLEAMLSAHVPEGWPPGEYDRPAIEFFRDRLAENPAAEGWYGWYAIERPAESGEAVVVGAGGYFGPPDADGVVEIGYSVLPAFQGRGYATELVGALVARAFATPGIARVIAHTFPGNAGSIKVLERAGFAAAGPGREPGTLRFVQERPSP